MSQRLKSKKDRKKFLVLAISTAITVLVWIGFDIYRIFHKTTIPKVLQEQLKPIEPGLDTKTLKSLEERRFISKRELDSVPQLSPSFSEPSVSQSKEASPESELIEIEREATREASP